MGEQRTRRGFLRAGAAAGLLVFAAPAACSSHKPPPASTGGAEPLTITHAFGETTIPEPPKRVVSAGFTGQDDLLALGIVPVAVTAWFGDQPFGVWPRSHRRLRSPTATRSSNHGKTRRRPSARRFTNPAR